MRAERGRSGVGPGQNDKQVWIAPRLGATFSPSGPVFTSPNQQRFAAASARDMTAEAKPHQALIPGLVSG
jgi:hypothetical protein